MTDDKRLVQILFTAALTAVEPEKALGPYLERVREVFRAGPFQRLVVAGFGKAGLAMARAAEKTLGGLISGGMIIVPHPTAPLNGLRLETIDVATAAHPHPDNAGVEASRRIVEHVLSCDQTTLLLLLVSGGGSALFTAPAEGITLEEKLATARLLMEAGADIQELNTVRKHLSAVKGGQLARLAHPARTVSLLISDVPGDRPDVIASGPAVPDPTTFGDALTVLGRRGLLHSVPASVRHRLEQGATGALPETPKPGDPIFDTVTTTIAACNRDALEAAATEARRAGLEVRIDSESITGEAVEAGRMLASEALRIQRELSPPGRICLMSGGETTVTVRGHGKGGRNQELALSFAEAIAGTTGITLLSAGTDGIDGPTDAAGAIVDGETVARAHLAGFDPAASLAANGSHTLLKRCGALLMTGPTGTNVMDLQIIVINGV